MTEPFIHPRSIAAVAPPLRPIDIERLLIWTYRDQLADLLLGDDPAGWSGIADKAHSGDGVARMLAVGRVGAQVDERAGWYPLQDGSLHHDAIVVHQTVASIDSLGYTLVVRNARGATRPDPMIDVKPKAHPVLTAKGSVRVQYAPWDKHRNFGWCPIDWDVTAAEIEAGRLEYRLWWSSLVIIATELIRKGKLVKFRPNLPSAPELPVDNTQIY